MNKITSKDIYKHQITTGHSTQNGWCHPIVLWCNFLISANEWLAVCNYFKTVSTAVNKKQYINKNLKNWSWKIIGGIRQGSSAAGKNDFRYVSCQAINMKHLAFVIFWLIVTGHETYCFTFANGFNDIFFIKARHSVKLKVVRFIGALGDTELSS